MHWAWSCINSTGRTSVNPPVSVHKKKNILIWPYLSLKKWNKTTEVRDLVWRLLSPLNNRTRSRRVKAACTCSSIPGWETEEKNKKRKNYKWVKVDRQMMSWISSWYCIAHYSTWIVLISVAKRRSSACIILIPPCCCCWRLISRCVSRAPKSHGDDHWAKYKRNSSFHDSCRRSCWSARDRVWNGVSQRTHLTAMNSNRADVS